ncbi:MAG TPA: hypothetical protein VNO50_12895 [Pyrinomonadaceae bacterium]|nr:hypothetical protein [Pyrinomonadaceae bacterium]
MNTRHAFRGFVQALAAVSLCAFFGASDISTQSQTPTQKPNITTGGGIIKVTLVLDPGTVAVILPDDMRAGDTISGTVTTEPKGQTTDERAKNQEALAGLPLLIDGAFVKPFSGSPEKEREPLIQHTFWIYTAHVSGKDGSLPIAVADREGKTLAQTSVLLDQMLGEVPNAVNGATPSGAVTTPDPKVDHPTHPSGAVITPGPTATNPPFFFQPVGQTGRSIVVTGPFDGNGTNTELRVGDGEARDKTGRVDIIAESPRKAVFAAPADVIGSTRLHLTEGNAKASGNYRNLGVNLSAPKTDLLKGERTVLTVKVSGLAGITREVPLQLDSKGVISMDGGNFQNLRITPAEVNRDGIYTATRSITGQQSGGFTVVATVIVNRFDVCLTDDSNRRTGILWNTFTGDYIFTNPNPSPTSGGQPSSSGTSAPSGTPPGPSGGPSLTGKGKLAMKGCVIVLTHNAPDRRVFARLDACTKAGDAKIETTSPKASVSITDGNVSDNACPK